MNAIVLTCDRYRVITQHMIHAYDRLWPDHPFIWMIPFQTLRGADSPKTRYIESPEDSPDDIPRTVLRLLDKLDDEEWIYWCADDKYPTQLVLEKVKELMSYVEVTPDISGLMFCRCRVTLDRPDLALYPGERVTPQGDILLERNGWFQIWIHQFLRVKVLRHFFEEMSAHIPSAKLMCEQQFEILKLADHRLYVTKQNLAVFGESTRRGRLTRNCYESIRKTPIQLPKQLQHPIRERVTMGKL